MREMDEKVVTSCQNWPFSFVSNIPEVIFPTLYLDVMLVWKQFCFPPRKSMNRRNETTNMIAINSTVFH